MLLLLALAFKLAPDAFAARSHLEQARILQQQGKIKEARREYHLAADSFRASGDQRNLATALSAAGNVSISLGDYQEAIRDLEEAIAVWRALKDESNLGPDLNSIGLANKDLGNYPEALERYQEALKINRGVGNLVGVIGPLNNIGNIRYFQGRYMDALENYQAALDLVNANAGQSWYSWGRKLTLGNVATLYQRLGLDEQALELYQQSAGRPEDMPAAEYAQSLMNLGVLYRHLGDPVKALETYHSAQVVVQTARAVDEEIGVFRSTGITKTMDFNDLPGALQAFTEQLRLARQSSNPRETVLANLYLGEVLRRLHRYKEANSHLREAAATAQTAGFVEEHWKSLYTLGRIAEETGSPQAAVEDYRAAIAIIESVRANIRAIGLRTDFLADKRDVYDSLIAFELREPQPSVDELFHWMERSRARTLQDRVAERTPLIAGTLPEIRAHIPAETTLVEFWMGSQNSVAVWVNASGSGIVRYAHPEELRNGLDRLFSSLQREGNDWKQLSRELGASILAGIPLQRHMIVVQDGPLNFPFEVLAVPASDRLLIEQADVSYLPSARLIAMPDVSRRRWLWPWNREMVALGDPPLSSSDALAENEHWQPLPASAAEVHGIARIIPGKAEIHLGSDARTSYLFDFRLAGLPLLHLSTHAMVDPERPERSRILLASDSGSSPYYLFLDRVSNLDLNNVGLVTVSACDTAQGKTVGGEGTRAFSQAFLAAGASATVTSLWKVGDDPTAHFMYQFYDSLSHGTSKAEALREAKLRFLRSKSSFSSPRHWAAFVVTGDGWNPTTHVIPWSAILLSLAAAVGLISLFLWRIASVRAAKRAPHTVLQSR